MGRRQIRVLLVRKIYGRSDNVAASHFISHNKYFRNVEYNAATSNERSQCSTAIAMGTKMWQWQCNQQWQVAEVVACVGVLETIDIIYVCVSAYILSLRLFLFSYWEPSHLFDALLINVCHEFLYLSTFGANSRLFVAIF